MTRSCTQLHSHVGRTLVPPSAASGRETGLESLFASVHRLPRLAARSLPFSYGSTGDEITTPRSSCKLAGVGWGDGVAGSSSVWTSTECVRPSEAPPPSEHAWQLRVSKCRSCYIIHPRVACANPARRKGLSGRGGVSLSAELAAAGRWSYGNERCVGDLATVLLHSCVRPAPPPPLVSVRASAATGISCDSGC